MAYSIHNLKGAALTIIVSAVFFSLIASNFPNYSKGIYAQEDAVQYYEYKYANKIVNEKVLTSNDKMIRMTSKAVKITATRKKHDAEDDTEISIILDDEDKTKTLYITGCEKRDFERNAAVAQFCKDYDIFQRWIL